MKVYITLWLYTLQSKKNSSMDPGFWLIQLGGIINRKRTEKEHISMEKLLLLWSCWTWGSVWQSYRDV